MHNLISNKDQYGQREPKGLGEAIVDFKSSLPLLNYPYYGLRIDGMLVVPGSEPNVETAIVKSLNNYELDYSSNTGEVYVVFDLPSDKKKGKFTFKRLDDLDFQEFELPVFTPPS